VFVFTVNLSGASMVEANGQQSVIYTLPNQTAVS